MKRIPAFIGDLFSSKAPRTGDYPWGPISDALESTFIRLILLFVIMLASLSLGTALAYKSFAGLYLGIVEIHWVLIGSLFFSLGFIVFPATLIFTVLFIRYEWPIRTLILPALAFVYVSYDSTDFSLNRSSQAKMEKQIDAALEKAARPKPDKPDE